MSKREKDTDANNAKEYSRKEIIKQRIDIFCSCLFGLFCIGTSFDLLHVGFGVPVPCINGWRISGLIIIFSLIPAMAGMFWIVGRCIERADFNSLPSSKFTWGIPAIAIIVMAIICIIARGAHV